MDVYIRPTTDFVDFILDTSVSWWTMLYIYRYELGSIIFGSFIELVIGDLITMLFKNTIFRNLISIEFWFNFW